jgi:prevent-host-death family protein
VSVTVNLYVAKTRLSELVERASAGEEIVIAKSGTPMARLVPLAGADAGRVPGGWEGLAYIAEDFDAPLPDELLQGFLGGLSVPPASPGEPTE